MVGCAASAEETAALDAAADDTGAKLPPVLDGTAVAEEAADDATTEDAGAEEATAEEAAPPAADDAAPPPGAAAPQSPVGGVGLEPDATRRFWPGFGYLTSVDATLLQVEPAMLLATNRSGSELKPDWSEAPPVTVIGAQFM